MKFWRITEAAVLAASLLSFGLAIYLAYHFAGSRPALPDPAIGRIYLHNVHGQIAYLTRPEQWTLNGLFWLAGIAFVAGVCIDRIKRPFA